MRWYAQHILYCFSEKGDKMENTKTTGKLPWQVWASFWIMLLFALIHILIALGNNILYLYVSFALEVVLAIGLLKLWKWAYFVTMAFSVLNIILLVIAMAENFSAVNSLIISIAYLVLIVKTYIIVFRTQHQ